MKAKHYKKIRRLHLSAHQNILAVGLELHAQPLRAWIVQWAYWHKDKAHQNYLKWYAEFNKTMKWGADVDQIRKDHNYPDFNPKWDRRNEPDEKVHHFMLKSTFQENGPFVNGN